MPIAIAVLGDKHLRKTLRLLPGKTERLYLRRSLRHAIKTRLRPIVLGHLSGQRVRQRTGRLYSAIAGGKLKSSSRKNEVKMGIALPTPSELGIDAQRATQHARAQKVSYYPAALEYGSKKNPQRYPEFRMFRDAIDQHVAFIVDAVADELGRQITQ